VQVDVAFTPAEAASAPTGIVVDVLRATSTIAQALDAGYERVVCCAEIEDARALRTTGALLAGERMCVRIPGFDLGNSPREFTERRGETVILTTTNGTRTILAAAERCERVVAASLLNLAAVAADARGRGEDVAIVCAGVEGAFTLDDAYCAGRLVEEIGGVATDAAEAAVRIRRSFASAYDGLAASKSARNLFESGLEADVEWCSREGALDVVPRLIRLAAGAAELVS
jgi:2-phosphosulfolactate phosphatase